MSVLNTFVAFDLETTGLDPEVAEIIEIGAVKVEEGEVAGEFDHLVRPSGSIPPSITRLTGISDDDVRGSPELSQALSSFREFIGEYPLVSYNAPFDLAFLRRHPGFHNVRPVWDCLELARCVLPRLINHRLRTLIRFLRIGEDQSHRALNDARGLALAFLRLIDTLMDKDLATVQEMLRIAQGTGSSLEYILREVTGSLIRRVPRTKIRARETDVSYLRELFNVEGLAVSSSDLSSEGKLPERIDVDLICSIFAEQGVLSRCLKGYEKRDQQLVMARVVAETFNNSQWLVVEAGTGTGKSLAYLVPAIYWSVNNRSRVVVSTNTKNLQEQLFYKDLPELARILAIPFGSTLLKGRSNYICLNKWYTALSQVETAFSDDERRAAVAVLTWLEETTTGDIAENNGLRGFRNATLWGKICAESNYCLGQRCKYHNRCFVTKVRKAALKSHIVVVNHSLLFSDLASENAVLADYEHLILDEAHNVEKVATQYLGRQMDVWRIRTLVRSLYSKELAETGMLVTIRQLLTDSEVDQLTLESSLSRIRMLIEISKAAWQEGQELFRNLTKEVRDYFGDNSTPRSQKIRYKKEEGVFKLIHGGLENYLHLLERLGSEVYEFCMWLKGLPDGTFRMQEELTTSLEGRYMDCQEICDDFAFLLAAEDDDYVYWVELPAREESFDTRLCAAPIDVSPLLSSRLYSRLKTIVFTSATITVGGDFSYFTSRLGIDPGCNGRVKLLALGSPFDYKKQSLLCIPSWVPPPGSPLFQSSIDEIIQNLTGKIRKGALVLFTSYAMLNESYSSLKDFADTEGIALLGQGLDGSRSNIMTQFIEEPGSVLFGTESFWEGVDLPGEALEVLVIVKLPFAVPTEPIVAARIERLEQQGVNPFYNYSLPEAVIKLRQGFGRLIRNRTDRGVVVILDNRVLTRDYGAVFMNSLPGKHAVFRSADEMVKGILEWFDLET